MILLKKCHKEIVSNAQRLFLMDEKIKVGLVEFVYQVISKYETKYYLSFKKKKTLNDLRINKTILLNLQSPPWKPSVSYLKFDWQLMFS